MRPIVLASVLITACQYTPTNVSRETEHEAVEHPYHAVTSVPLTGIEQLRHGEINRFVFSAWAGPAIPVWLYVPSDVDITRAPLLVMMHGAKRGAHRYLREWAPLAQEGGFVVIAPEFSETDFQRSLRYNLGYVFDQDGAIRDEATWSFSAIEPLFDTVRAVLRSERTRYNLYGHSAGSQFVHRYLYYKPDARVDRYLAANAGWYTFPDLSIGYPYGLKGADVDELAVKRSLSKEVFVLLGDQDTDVNHVSLRRTAEAMRQGEHRFARGLSFYEAGAKRAQTYGVPYRWQVRVVEDVAHSNGGIAKVAADLIR